MWLIKYCTVKSHLPTQPHPRPHSVSLFVFQPHCPSFSSLSMPFSFQLVFGSQNRKQNNIHDNRTTRRGKIYQEGIWLSRVLEKEIWKRTERGDIFKRNNRRQIPWPKEEKTESNCLLFLYCFCFIQGWLFSFNPSAFLSCCSVQFSSVQSLSHVWLFATPWIAACQASLSITNSRSLLKPTSIESVMPSNHLILCRPLLLLPPIPPSIRVFHMRWPKYWSFTSASVLPMNTQDWSPLG